MYLGKIVEIGPPDKLYAAPDIRTPARCCPPSRSRTRRQSASAGGSSSRATSRARSTRRPAAGSTRAAGCTSAWASPRIVGRSTRRSTSSRSRTITARPVTTSTETLKTDVGIAHIGQDLVRRGTPRRRSPRSADRRRSRSLRRPRSIDTPAEPGGVDQRDRRLLGRGSGRRPTHRQTASIRLGIVVQGRISQGASVEVPRYPVPRSGQPPACHASARRGGDGTQRGGGSMSRVRIGALFAVTTIVFAACGGATTSSAPSAAAPSTAPSAAPVTSGSLRRAIVGRRDAEGRRHPRRRDPGRHRLDRHGVHRRTATRPTSSNQVIEGLVALKPGTIGEIIPVLAEAWTVSDDGLTYTFNLQRGRQVPRRHRLQRRRRLLQLRPLEELHRRAREPRLHLLLRDRLRRLRRDSNMASCTATSPTQAVIVTLKTPYTARSC